MAYSQRPESPEEVIRMASSGGYKPEKVDQISALYDYLRSNYRNIERPLLLQNTGGKNEVKVLPSILTADSTLDIADKTASGRTLARRAGVSLSIKFGIGSAPGNGGIRYNMGNAAEGVMAAAIAARFINKAKRITAADVERVLSQLESDVTNRSQRVAYVTKTFKSENFKTSRETKIVPDDDVRVEIALSPINMALVFPNRFFADDSEERSQALVDRASIIGPCVQYGNSREISQLSNVMYYNRVKDDIHVNADGVGDETGTKVDIYLTINGEKSVEIPGRYSAPRSRGGLPTSQKLNITQISLKREVNQFAQVGGWDIETVQNLWGRILGEDIRTNSQLLRYYEYQNTQEHLTTKHHAAAVMRNIYIWGNSRLQSKFRDPRWREHFVDTIHNFATYNEENVALVEIVGSTFERYDMRKLLPALNGVPSADIPPNLTLSSRIRMSRPQNATSRPLPVVVVSVENANNGQTHDILQLRHKIEWGGTAIRNYVEKQPGLHTYAFG